MPRGGLSYSFQTDMRYLEDVLEMISPLSGNFKIKVAPSSRKLIRIHSSVLARLDRSVIGDILVNTRVRRAIVNSDIVDFHPNFTVQAYINPNYSLLI